jgi:hypothetical protein
MKRKNSAMSRLCARPKFAATMLGMVSYETLDKTAEVLFEHFPEAIRLPLVTRTFEWMSEGLVCLVADWEKSEFLMVPPEEREKEVIEFYDRIDQDDLDYFATTPKTAPFYYEMVERIKKRKPPELKWISFEMPGPIVLGDTLKQKNGNPAIHHETLRDILIKTVSMKSRWMEKWIQEEIPGVQVVCDQPEPTLVVFTSAGGSGSRDDVLQAIHGGFSGVESVRWVHCCSNIDWSLLTEADIDVINFDAYMHGDKIALYGKEFKGFLERGGSIGWGVVPVADEYLSQENVPNLVDKLEKGIDSLVQKGIDEELVAGSSWVLPSCDPVLLSPEKTDLAISMTSEISRFMKRKYGYA